MKIDTVTFVCDEPDCRTSQMTVAGDLVESYLVLVDAGWCIDHPPDGQRNHYCPKHASIHRPEANP